MPLRLLPLIAGLLPVAAIHLSYVLAIAAARVPACIPYLSGCTSISSTGRYPPASYLFKATMLPEAVLLVLFWTLSARWLNSLQEHGRDTPGKHLDLVVAGSGGALALIAYVTFLGTQEPFYEFMRRFGVYVFFLLTIVAQLTLAIRLRRLVIKNALRMLANAMLWLAVLPFALGALNLVLKAVLVNADASQNVIEWLVVLLMQSNILLSFFAWRLTGFRGRYAVATS